jgi:hypothetical protein
LLDERTAVLDAVVLRADDKLLVLDLYDDELVVAYTNPPLRRFTGPDILVRLE